MPNDGTWPDIRTYMQELFDMDVVVVCTAGNQGRKAGRSQIDTVPQLWESANFPLIVTGAVTNPGLALGMSQNGPHVTVWAPGKNVGCVQAPDNTATGTSPAAAAVS